MNFIKVGSACPVTKVADVDFNVENINLGIDEAYDKRNDPNYEPDNTRELFERNRS